MLKNAKTCLYPSWLGLLRQLRQGSGAEKRGHHRTRCGSSKRFRGALFFLVAACLATEAEGSGLLSQCNFERVFMKSVGYVRQNRVYFDALRLTRNTCQMNGMPGSYFAACRKWRAQWWWGGGSGNWRNYFFEKFPTRGPEVGIGFMFAPNFFSIKNTRRFCEICEGTVKWKCGQIHPAAGLHQQAPKQNAKREPQSPFVICWSLSLREHGIHMFRTLLNCS